MAAASAIAGASSSGVTCYSARRPRRLLSCRRSPSLCRPRCCAPASSCTGRIPDFQSSGTTVGRPESGASAFVVSTCTCGARAGWLTASGCGGSLARKASACGHGARSAGAARSCGNRRACRRRGTRCGACTSCVRLADERGPAADSAPDRCCRTAAAPRPLHCAPTALAAGGRFARLGFYRDLSKDDDAPAGPPKRGSTPPYVR
jgi:hypothetical protein